MLVEKIDLSKDKIDDPLNAHTIDEGRFGIAQFTQDVPYLTTYGISCCKGIVFYDEQTKTGLLCHLSLTKDHKITVAHLVDSFLKPFSRVDAYLVFGVYQADSCSWLHAYWPTMEQLTVEITSYKPRRLIVDEHPGYRNTGTKGIVLDLSSGRLNQVKSWIWSEHRNQSINKSYHGYRSLL